MWNAISVFAEGSRVVPTAAGCHLTPVVAWLFQRFLDNLRRNVSAHPPTPNA
jgi:hypothetical protein